MTEAEANALIKEAESIDLGQAAHQEAAADGRVDEKGNIVPPPVDNPDARAQAWLIIPQTIAWAITTAMPETAPAYTPERCMDLARAFVPVADKYGWDGIGDAPELTLAITTLAFAAPGFMAFKARKAVALEASKAKGEGDKLATANYVQPVNGSAVDGG